MLVSPGAMPCLVSNQMNTNKEIYIKIILYQNDRNYKISVCSFLVTN